MGFRFSAEASQVATVHNDLMGFVVRVVLDMKSGGGENEADTEEREKRRFSVCSPCVFSVHVPGGLERILQTTPADET